jgi:hypothetical protein
LKGKLYEKKKGWLTSANEPLLLLRDLSQGAANFDALNSAITAQEGVTGSCLSWGSNIPIPIYGDMKKCERFKNVLATDMWHPLFWLPERLYNRRTLVLDNGEEGPEDDDVWCLKIIFELNKAGLYERKTGKWVDVLYEIGIDVDTPQGQQRIKDFQQGTPDAELEAFDIDKFLSKRRIKNPDWSLDLVGEHYDYLFPIAMGHLANNFLQVLNTVDASNMTFEEKKNVLYALFYFVRVTIQDGGEQIYDFAQSSKNVKITQENISLVTKIITDAIEEVWERFKDQALKTNPCVILPKFLLYLVFQKIRVGIGFSYKYFCFSTLSACLQKHKKTSFCFASLHLSVTTQRH